MAWLGQFRSEAPFPLFLAKPFDRLNDYPYLRRLNIRRKRDCAAFNAVWLYSKES